MTSAAVILWIAFAAVLIIALMGPRRAFRTFQAPLLRNPDANEPSDTGYALAAGSTWLSAIVLGVAAIAVTGSATHKLTASEVSSVAQSVADEVDGAHSSGFLDEPDVPTIAKRQADGGKTKVKKLDGENPDKDRYEFTNAQGKFPICLTVDKQGGDLGEDILETDYSAEVDDGVCT